MGVVVFDFDGTLIAGDSFRLFSRRAAQSWRQRMWTDLQAVWLKLGCFDNTRYKERVLASVWERTTADQRRAVVQDVRKQLLDRAYPAMVKKLKTHAERGDRTLVVTASPEFYVQAVVREWAPDVEVYGLQVTGDDDGALEVQGMHGPAKADLIRSLFGEQSTEEMWVYTDHESDWPLLQMATRSVLVDPSSRLVQRMNRQGLDYAIEYPNSPS